MTYKIGGIACMLAQFLVAFAAFRLGRPKEGLIGILFGLANGIIYLWR